MKFISCLFEYKEEFLEIIMRFYVFLNLEIFRDLIVVWYLWRIEDLYFSFSNVIMDKLVFILWNKDE